MKNPIKRIAVLMLALAMFVPALGIPFGNAMAEGDGTQAALAEGWERQADGEYKYVRNGAYVASEWLKDGSKWYYLNADGIMAKGWLEFKGKWYYLKSGGAMVTGTYTVDGINEKFNSSGTYAGPSKSAMFTGWAKGGPDKSWYYYKKGKLAKGWLKSGSSWYFLKSNGVMASNEWVKSGGKWYFMNASGAMATKWQKIDGLWYYLKPGSGQMQKGWLKSGGKWYYLKGSGAMASNEWITLKGVTYFLQESGAMMTSWMQSADGAWYYFKSSGAMAVGKEKIGSTNQYFTADGKWLKDASGISSGIDVYNGKQDIDWAKVKASGTDFAIMRALRCLYTEKTGARSYLIDDRFESYMRGAKANGIKVGAYLVTGAYNKDEMRKEIEFFVNSAEAKRLKADGIAFDFPVYIDLEYGWILTGNPSYESRTDVVRYGMQLLQQYGYTPGLYCNMTWANTYVNAAQLSKEGYSLWIARYPGSAIQPPVNDKRPNGDNLNGAEADMWQYTDQGKVDGITGNVDMNYYYARWLDSYEGSAANREVGIIFE